MTNTQHMLTAIITAKSLIVEAVEYVIEEQMLLRLDTPRLMSQLHYSLRPLGKLINLLKLLPSKMLLMLVSISELL